MFRFDNSYARLPDRFFAPVTPTPVSDPGWLGFNRALARDMGLPVDEYDRDALLAWLSGNQIPPGAQPIAMAYAGHQFGNLVPQLGDGRALLLGEHIGPDQARFDIQLKGSGATPYSRSGDGRAALGPVLREYLLSEAMHSLGVPTTRALAAVTTGDPVLRERPLPGAILTRVASSHIRVGTFQYFAIRNDLEAIDKLLAHVIARHYPGAGESAHPALAVLEAVAQRQASLIADWMSLGFIHGVMNTDNCAISGETIDYGPCAFIDRFDPAAVYSSIDRRGRYAWQNQPTIGQWNLARFAECLLPLIDDDQDRAIEKASQIIHAFPDIYQDEWLQRMRRKLGLQSERGDDAGLIDALLEAMHTDQADFTLTFWQLAEHQQVDPPGASHISAWLERWRQRLDQEDSSNEQRRQLMRGHNPLFIPRNHRVEQAIVAAEKGDLAPFEALHQVTTQPFDEHPTHAELSQPPRPEEEIAATFCGT